jgi:hypothetical protein
MNAAMIFDLYRTRECNRKGGGPEQKRTYRTRPYEAAYRHTKVGGLAQVAGDRAGKPAKVSDRKWLVQAVDAAKALDRHFRDLRIIPQLRQGVASRKTE